MPCPQVSYPVIYRLKAKTGRKSKIVFYNEVIEIINANCMFRIIVNYSFENLIYLTLLF